MKREEGIGSVEVLIASAITLVMLTGTMVVLNKSMGMSETAATLTDLNQNLQAGMDFVVQDFISAGWGIPIGGIPIPSGSGSSAIKRPGPPGTNLSFASQTLAAVNPGSALGPVANGRPTDMVNILYVDSLLALNKWPLTAVTMDGNGSTITVDSRTVITGVNYPIRVGDLIYLSNANGGTVQYVTSVGGQTITFGSGDPLSLNQPTASQGSIGLLQNGGVFPPTTATRVLLITYYLDYTTDPSTPRLMRRINSAAGQPIALVIEDLQLTYDLVDGNLNPTGIDTPVAPNSPNQIRKANIYLSGRSGTKVRDNGSFARRSLTTQVSLRSLSFIDRYR